MRVLLTCFVMLLASVAQAETLAILPPSGVNVSEDLLQAAGDVLRGHLVRLGRAVIVVPGPPTRIEATAQQAADEARNAATDGAVVLHVTRLGSTARLRVTVYAPNGQVRWCDEMPAASPDDMHAVLDRLARGYAENKPSSATADIDSVTVKESEPMLRRQATSTFGLQLGFMMPVNSEADGSAIPGGGIFWLYDTRTFLAEISLDLYSKDSQGGVGVGLGAYYPLQRTDFSPYVGGGLRWAWMETNSGADDGSGLQVYAAAGMLLGRLSSVQVRAQLAYFINTFESHAYSEYNAALGGYGSYSDSDGYHGHGLTLGVGIGF